MSSDDDEEEDWRIFSNSFRVADDFVSFHFPSQRFVLCILSEVLKWLPSKECLYTTLSAIITSGETTTSSKMSTWDEKTVLNIVDIALCPLILSQQIMANMWTRNSNTKMYRQVSFYYSHFWTHTGLDIDIFGLQLGIEYLGANRVLSQMLERFDVLEYFLSSSSTSSSCTLSPEHQEKMAESFLALVATLVADRRHVGHTRERTIRQEIVQRLALGKMTYSEFERCIAIDLVEDPCFKSILSRVADYHRPDGFENGFFTLKDECWCEIDPFFSHYLKGSRNELEMRYVSFELDVVAPVTLELKSLTNNTRSYTGTQIDRTKREQKIYRRYVWKTRHLYFDRSRIRFFRVIFFTQLYFM